MKNNSRKKESVKNLLVVMVGFTCIFGLTMNIRRVEAADTIEQAEEIERQETEELAVILDTDRIFEEAERIPNKLVINQIAEDLVAGSFLKSVEFKPEDQPAGVVLSYEAGEHEQALTRAKKDQMVLINTSVLMSLYPEIDVVKIEVYRGNEYYERMIYRPDLEAYFRTSLDGSSNKAAFERIAGEFNSIEAVNEYWNMKHPFDSRLGERVEKFFKYEFPVHYSKTEYPYIDEELEQETVSSYGYKLFIQGLSYEHPLMNYYSAYRLIEYYGTSDIDEILLELASCSARTEEENVKKACDFAMQILTAHTEDDEVRVFTRYAETTLKGGKKLFVLVQNKLVELARWNSAEEGGFEVVSLSPDYKSVLCKVITKERNYLYVLPVSGDGTYEINEVKAVRDGTEIEELTGRLQELTANTSLTEQEIETSWLYGNVLGATLNGSERFIYKDGTWETQREFEQNYDTGCFVEQLRQELDQDIEEQQTSSMQMKVSKITVLGEVITVYEYTGEAQKEAALTNWKKQEQVAEEEEIGENTKIYSKGKIFVVYSGIKHEIIDGMEAVIK